ncbi:uncharacterized protein LOC142348768 isoform X2 [Convolutriloba macropyga]|uniref:uncharacterized protein LOC142348768 isoform X2 n=1 Tax=Convolutriloba macropyga TaxID=536237 RepID=UPI003F51B9B4
MNTSVTIGRFTYMCDKCHSSPKTKIQWGPWKICCIKEAQDRNIPTTPRSRAMSEENLATANSTGGSSGKATLDTPRRIDTSKKSKRCNLLGPFMTNQKTTCGAMWTWEEGLTEHKKPELGIMYADVYKWGENYAKTARVP